LELPQAERQRNAIASTSWRKGTSIFEEGRAAFSEVRRA
jgi:hypothetical protein